MNRKSINFWLSSQTYSNFRLYCHSNYLYQSKVIEYLIKEIVLSNNEALNLEIQKFCSKELLKV